MYHTDEQKKREAQLLEAFTDSNFQDKLKDARISIEDRLAEFIIYLKKKLNPEQKIYENIESRIKSPESFKEKLKRKDYIKTWSAFDDIASNQRIIAANLPDLLGFRINCFFWKDEKVIYDILREYYDQKNFENIYLDFSENTKQQNGHTIYKLSGKYRNEYCFELQIKSIMHNIWGEVEHKTIYKNRDYDADLSNKITITEEVFNILQASDRQLVSLFKKQNDEKHLTNAFFFEKTKQIVAGKSGTDILAKHYNGFFQVFSDPNSLKHMKRYVAYSLLDENYIKEPVTLNTSNEKFGNLKIQIITQFLEYNLRCLYYICDLIYDIPDFDFFMSFLSEYLLKTYTMETEAPDECDAFDDDNDEPADDNIVILTLLENKIGGRKKND